MNIRMILSALLLLAATTAVQAGGRHVFALDREADAAPAAKVLLYQDTAVAASGAVPTEAYYAIDAEPFPVPQPKADIASTRNWVWWGAAGAALAAGVAAWIVWSGESPKAQPDHVIAQF